MRIINVEDNHKEAYNSVVTHPLQSFEWGEFRKKTGITVIRRLVEENGKYIFGFTLTIHQIPKTPFTIGYMPKTNFPPEIVFKELGELAQKNNCIFIQLEPNVVKTIYKLKDGSSIQYDNPLLSTFDHISVSSHPLFTKYTFRLNLTPTEAELLANMHQKTRYNIKVAQKHTIRVSEDNTSQAFERYWELTQATTKRQKFYAHTKLFHKLQWETLTHTPDANSLSSHLITASIDGKILTSLLLFVFKNTLYYPYGASSDEKRNTMHSTLAMWEAIRFGKKLGLLEFDMWGSLGPNPNTSDPWHGFHRFKLGFGGELIEFLGSYDYIANPILYKFYQVADKGRILYLKFKK